MLKLTKAQIRFLTRLENEDGYGPIRHMAAHDRSVGHRLKSMGLVMLDGAIASSLTEGNAAYNGMTFVVTEAGRLALSDKEGAK